MFGNRLDYILRQSQDGQTTGIPVGPDHSRVTAEIILSSVDEELCKNVDPSKALRHVDDYWIGGNSYDDCETNLQNLRQILAEYSLDINEQKTKIVQTSSILSENWPYHIETQIEEILKSESTKHEARFVSLLGNVVEYSSSSQDDGVIKFFLRRFDRWKAWDTHWTIMEPFLAHCAVQFPHSFDYVAQIIVWRIKTDRKVDIDVWEEVAQSVLHTASRSGRDAEALWSIWFLKELGRKIHFDIAVALSSTTNPIVVAAVAHLAARDLITKKFNLPSLWEAVEYSPLAGPCWPLALELQHLGVKRPEEIDMAGPVALTSIFDAGCSPFNGIEIPKHFWMMMTN